MALKDSILKVVIKAQDLSKAAVDGFKQGWREAAEEADKASKSVKKTTKEIDKYGNELKDSDKDQGRFIDNSGRMREANGRFVKGLGETKSGLQGASSGIGGYIKRLAGLAAAYVSLNTVKNALLGILQTGDQFKQLELQMTALMGSIEGGQEATRWIENFTKDTPLQLEQTTEAFTRLKSFGIDPMDGALQAMVDQNSKLGGSQEKLLGIVTAFGQAWAKQKLQSEEIMQLIERGVPVWDLLADATGKNVAQLNEMSRKGELSREVISALMAEMGGQSAGAAQAQMDLLSGKVSNLTDHWTQFKKKIADSGLYDSVVESLSSILTTVTQLSDDGTLDRWAQNISDTFVSVKEGAESLANALGPYFDFMLRSWEKFGDDMKPTAEVIRGLFSTDFLLSYRESFEKLFATLDAGWKILKASNPFSDGTFKQALQEYDQALENISASYMSQRDAAAETKDVIVDLEKLATEATEKREAASKKAGEQEKKTQNEIDRTGAAYTKAGRKALEAFDKIIARQGDTRESAKATSADIVDAYVDAFGKVQTAAEKADLNAGLKKALEEGKISLAQYNKAISEAAVSTDDFVVAQKGAVAVLVETNEELKNTGEKTEEAAEKGGSAASSLAEIIDSLSNRLGQLSDAAKQAFDNHVFGELEKIGTDAGEAGNRIKALDQNIKELREHNINAFDTSGLGDYVRNLGIMADEIERSYLKQTSSIDSINSKFNEGKLSLEQYIRLMRQAKGAADLLDQAELDNITRSIQAAKEQMEGLRESTLSTLNSLKQQQLDLVGSALEQENFDYSLRKLDLEEKLAEARRTGDKEAITNAEEALRIAKEIHDFKVKEIEKEEKAAKQRAAEEKKAKEEAEAADKQRAIDDKKAAAEKGRQRKADEQAREREQQAEKVRQAQEKLKQKNAADDQARFDSFQNRINAQQENNRTSQDDQASQTTPTTVIRIEAPDGSGANVHSNDKDGLIKVLQKAGRLTR